jgi:glycosyltransferase involved in cell wall biosynthesis
MAVLSSVIIPTRDRPGGVAETLRRLLDAHQQPRFETIVVDDGSSPPVSLSVPGVRVIRTPGIERSRARNLGALSAKGDLILFMDDDIGVPTGFVTAHERGATEFGDVLCVGGISSPPEWAASPFGRFRRLIEDASQTRPRGLVTERNFCTAQNMSMRRDTFLSLGGFDPDIVSSEDQDLALRFSAQGGRIVFLPEATALHHDSNADFAAYCRRHEWGSRAMAPFLRRYPDWVDNRQRLRFEAGAAGARSLQEQSALLARQLVSQPSILRILLGAVAACERFGLSDRVLFPMYRVGLGLHLFRGFREGLSKVETAPPLPSPIEPESL